MERCGAKSEGVEPEVLTRALAYVDCQNPVPLLSKAATKRRFEHFNSSLHRGAYVCEMNCLNSAQRRAWHSHRFPFLLFSLHVDVGERDKG